MRSTVKNIDQWAKAWISLLSYYIYYIKYIEINRNSACQSIVPAAAVRLEAQELIKKEYK